MAKKQHWAKTLGMAINLATSIGAVIALGLLGGRWLGRKLEMETLFTVIGFALGVLGAGKIMWERLMSIKDSTNLITSDEPQPGEKTDK